MEYQRDVNPKGFMKITDRVQRKTHIRSHFWDHVGMSVWPNSTHITWNEVQCVLPPAEPGVWNKSIGNWPSFGKQLAPATMGFSCSEYTGTTYTCCTSMNRMYTLSLSPLWLTLLSSEAT